MDLAQHTKKPPDSWCVLPRSCDARRSDGRRNGGDLVVDVVNAGRSTAFAPGLHHAGETEGLLLAIRAIERPVLCGHRCMVPSTGTNERENPRRATSFAERSSAHQAHSGPSRHAGALHMSRERCIDEWVFTESEHSSQKCLLSSTERTTHWHSPRLQRSSGSCSDASGQPHLQRSDDGTLHLMFPKIRSIPGTLRRSCLDPAHVPSFIRTKDSNEDLCTFGRVQLKVISLINFTRTVLF